MAKALMLAAGASVSGASGDEWNLFGYRTDATTEANTQASATEGAAFTGLAMRVTAGGSGTNTLTFRDAGGAGQNVAAIAGTGLAQDTTHTDTLTAGDLFNVAYTDTGTDSTLAWSLVNVELASGYGAFVGAGNFNGTVADVASATRFFGICGDLNIDGNATEANVGFKARGYTTFEALQVRITANARTNDSVFKNRINSGDGTGTITFGAGVTGLLTATGLGDAIADGQLIDASLTLLIGVQDLTISLIGATLKSSDSQQDIWNSHQVGIARAASATEVYAPLSGYGATWTFGNTEAVSRAPVGFAGTASNLRCYLSDNTYTGDGTLKLYKNGSAVITTTLTAGGGAAWYENTADSISFVATDELSFAIDEGTSGSITIQMVGVTLAPTTASGFGGFNPYFSRHIGRVGGGSV
jgi:hypothetical protein